MTAILEAALAADTLILSNAGAHANEDWRGIIERKAADIANIGHTVWVINSNAARPDVVRSFCSNHGARYVILVGRERDTTSGSGTLRDSAAQLYSIDPHSWQPLVQGLGKVTEDIRRSTTGMWFDALEEVAFGSFDLAVFVKHNDDQQLTRFWPSDSTYPVRRFAAVRPGRYQILGAGRLSSPFAVWLKT